MKLKDFIKLSEFKYPASKIRLMFDGKEMALVGKYYELDNLTKDTNIEIEAFNYDKFDKEVVILIK